MPKKWFDMECQALKEKSKQFANMKHRNPWDKSLLQQHREILKHYKKICAFKKYNFWKEEVIKLESSGKHGERWERTEQTHLIQKSVENDGKNILKQSLKNIKAKLRIYCPKSKWISMKN